MHYQVIKDNFFEQLRVFLKAQVPEFKSVFDEKDGIYPVLGEFSRFIEENIHNDKLKLKCYAFINQALEEGGNKTEDIIVVQIFEPLYSNNNFVENARIHLNSKALKIFEKFFKKDIV